jgi:hypothetical protein
VLFVPSIARWLRHRRRGWKPGRVDERQLARLLVIIVAAAVASLVSSITQTRTHRVGTSRCSRVRGNLRSGRLLLPAVDRQLPVRRGPDSPLPMGRAGDRPFLWPVSVGAVVMVATLAIQATDAESLHLDNAAAAAAAPRPARQQLPRPEHGVRP